MLLELAPKHGWACGGQDRRVLGKLLRPKSNADIQDRQNQLMGNLSLNKELDFILTVNKWRDDPRYSSRYGEFAKDHKHVTVRTLKMEEKTADELRYPSLGLRRLRSATFQVKAAAPCAALCGLN